MTVRRFVVAQGVMGRIVANNAHWACFVPFDSEDETSLLHHWDRVAMKWSYSDDYGLGLLFCQHGRELGEISFIWGTVLTGRSPGGNFPKELRSRLIVAGVLTTQVAGKLDTVLAEVTAGAISGPNVRDRVAAILDVAAFESLSPELCLQVGLEDARQDYPDAEDIEMT